MARKNHDDKIPDIQAAFRTGNYSIRKLATKFDVSVGFVAKHTKHLEKDREEIVNAGVAFKSGIANDNEHLVNAVNEVVDERTRHLVYFQNSAMQGQRLANEALNHITKRYNSAEEEAKDELTGKALYAAKEHSAITGRNKETVLGKDPDTQVNVQQNNVSGIEIEFIE